MDAWLALLQPSVAFALLLLALLLGLFMSMALWLEGHLAAVPVCQTLFRWVGYPLFRLVPMLIFLSLSAAAFLGWDPDHQSVIVNGLVFDRFNSLMNLLFLFSLALPQLPLLARYHAPLLLLQLMVAFGLLFTWQMQALGIDEYQVLPSLSDGLIIVAVSVVMHQIGRQAAVTIGRWVEHRFHREQGDWLADDVLGVALQSPALILYTRGLGQQAAWLTG